ncbi:response regulator transcription factor [Tabrizicola oligotrophica]|uniref:Response regulator transcription factor n=1 Tax=Tabrizicola oligotrophica TaxID=2710650 RepID=A0A6M0QVG1_9RHOB|nr:response regulator transcription factor [Tabrizicola oligotrophica]NEY91410.1 response regulator transcription factor [Tabrizicola oligotrophica]
MRILLVEDDLPLSNALLSLLQGAGYAVDRAFDGASAEAMAMAERFDLMILDRNLPEMDGMAVLRSLRQRRNPVPVLVLTAQADPGDKVAGLDLGADDYMGKPFDIGEFEARVRSLLRRQAGQAAPLITLGALAFDQTDRRFSDPHGATLDLPARELALLELFFRRAGRVVAKESIVQSLTTLDEALSDNAIEQYVSRLRRRIQPHGLNLRTVRGLGYILEIPPEAARPGHG